MSKPNLHTDNQWGPALLSGIPFSFKQKVPHMPDVPARIKSLQHFNDKYLYDFNLERETIAEYDEIEKREANTLRRQQEAEEAAKKKKTEKDELAKVEAEKARVASLPLEPEKTDSATTDEVVNKDPPRTLEPSVVQDFEALGPRDDPFVAAELGTINDLEELRDVLACCDPVGPQATIQSQSSAKFSNSLKNIVFPRLSLDEAALNAPSFPSDPSNSPAPPGQNNHADILLHQHVAISAPGSRTDLVLSVPQQPEFERSQTTTAVLCPVKYDLGPENEKNFEDGQISPTPSPSERIPQDNTTHVTLAPAPPTPSHPEHPTSVISTTPVFDDEFYASGIDRFTIIPLPTTSFKTYQNPHSSNSESEINCRIVIPEPPSDNDPIMVENLVRMGFNKQKVLALYNASKPDRKRETHEEDQDTLITQLCNWTELDDKGIPPDVAQAAILFSPNDLGKAIEFVTVVSELVEMGFPLESVFAAVQSASLNKEQAVLTLLDPQSSPHLTPTPAAHTHQEGTTSSSSKSLLAHKNQHQQQQHHRLHRAGIVRHPGLLPLKKSGKSKEDKKRSSSSGSASGSGVSTSLSTKH